MPLNKETKQSEEQGFFHICTISYVYQPIGQLLYQFDPDI